MDLILQVFILVFYFDQNLEVSGTFPYYGDHYYQGSYYGGGGWHAGYYGPNYGQINQNYGGNGWGWTPGPPPTPEPLPTDLKPSITGWDTVYSVPCGEYTIHPFVTAQMRYTSPNSWHNKPSPNPTNPTNPTSSSTSSKQTSPGPIPYFKSPQEPAAESSNLEVNQVLEKEKMNRQQMYRPGGLRDKRSLFYFPPQPTLSRLPPAQCSWTFRAVDCRLRFSCSTFQLPALFRCDENYLELSDPKLRFCGNRKPRGNYFTDDKMQLTFRSENAAFSTVFDCTVVCTAELLSDTPNSSQSSNPNPPAPAAAEPQIVIPSESASSSSAGANINCIPKKRGDLPTKSKYDSKLKQNMCEEIDDSKLNEISSGPGLSLGFKDEGLKIPKPKLKYGTCRCGISLNNPNNPNELAEKIKGIEISSRLPIPRVSESEQNQQFRNKSGGKKSKINSKAMSLDDLEKNEVRILGGSETLPGTFPWTAALVRKTRNRPFCGASLINDRYLTTAAHCILNHRDSRGINEDIFFEVILNEHDITKSNELLSDQVGKSSIRVQVNKIIVHPQYNNRTYDFDIALLRLVKPIPIQKVNTSTSSSTSTGDKKNQKPLHKAKSQENSAQIRPVCLPRRESREADFEGKTAIVSGWGLTREGGQPSSTMMSAKVVIYNSTRCKDFYRGLDTITENMLCAGSSSEMIDSCVGDSGGPLVVEKNGRYTLAGLISWGRGCGRKNFPGVYARTSGQVVDWIQTTADDAIWCQEV